MSSKINKISKLIKNKINLLNNKVNIYYEGKIISIIDNVIKIVGLSKVLLNELIEFPNNLGYALIFNLDKYIVSAIPLSSCYSDIHVGMKVKSTGKTISVPVGKKLLGRIVNSLGEFIDGKEDIVFDKFYPIEQNSPLITDRRFINRPLCTGYKSIDSMIPIGLGQRELIIGDRKTGKTSLTIDIIINQRNTKVKCVYVSIGQKLSSVFNIVKKLEYYNALKYTIIVVASASESAVMQYISPYSGCSIAEYFRNIGDDVLIIYDDLSKHAISYRQISLLLRRFPGREAYPGDIFYLHSRLLERSSYVNYNFIKRYNKNYSKNCLSGSLTALPIVETYEGDISSFIPTNIISITDGQIFLESSLFNSGIKPAINPGISVSRVGSSAQTKIMKEFSGSLRTSLSQYYELLNFSQFSSELDDNTLYQLNYGKKIVEILKQNQYNPLSLFHQILILFSLKYKYLDNIDIKNICFFEKKLNIYASKNFCELENKINNQGLLNNKIIRELNKIIINFKKKYNF